MNKQLYIGVEGGGTKSFIHIEDASSNVIGSRISGIANIRISVAQSWESILAAVYSILRPLDIHHHTLHAGMGLAGCELQSAYDDFLQRPHPFSSLVVTSDAHITCLGGHAGESGAVIIAGTGVVGYQTEKGVSCQVGGWGFPHDDIGSGAWLGLEAIKITLQTLDGRTNQHEIFAKTIFEHFDNDYTAMVNWANQANSSNYAELAPLVVHLSHTNDETAINLLRQAANCLNNIERTLRAKQKSKNALPCILAGGVSDHLMPYLSSDLIARMVRPILTPAQGAILLSKQNHKQHAQSIS